MAKLYANQTIFIKLFSITYLKIYYLLNVLNIAYF